MLSVLIQNRPDAQTTPGGDTLQMHKTAHALQSAGHRVRISLDLTPDLAEIDVVHLFNLTRPTETGRQAANARRQNKPYVLSSVYWNLEAAVPWSAHGFLEGSRLRLAFAKARLVQRLRRDSAPDARATQRDIASGARLIFANSNAEKQHLVENFPALDAHRIHVTYNGIDPPETLDRRPDFFLCAGAIGPRKNQLHLVRAFRRLPGERLIVLGQTAPHCSTYRRAVELVAPSNVEFHDAVPHEQMAAYWARTRVLVQPSYIETPGLAALEAAACGIPVVVADAAPIREYFGAAALYCDPRSARSIARACRAAAAAAPPDAADLRRRFAWSTVLEPLLHAYSDLEAELVRRSDAPYDDGRGYPA